MSNNRIKGSGLISIIKALRVNNSLVYLNLNQNELTSYCGSEFLKTLKVNKSLNYLGLSLRFGDIYYRRNEELKDKFHSELEQVLEKQENITITHSFYEDYDPFYDLISQQGILYLSIEGILYPSREDI